MHYPNDIPREWIVKTGDKEGFCVVLTYVQFLINLR